MKDCGGIDSERHAWYEFNTNNERGRLCKKDYSAIQEERSKVIPRGWAN
jgi:hypothetical protein